MDLRKSELASGASGESALEEAPQLFPDAVGSPLWRAFSTRLLQARTSGEVRQLLQDSLTELIRVERVETYFSPSEPGAPATFFYPVDGAGSSVLAREGNGYFVRARGVSRIAAVIFVAEKADWSDFSPGDLMILEAIAAQVGLRLENFQLEEQLLRHQESSVQALAAAIEVKDRYTAGHTKRVGLYADVLVQHLPILESEKEKTRLAGVLHDIGKIGVPDRILLKPGSLTLEERDEMRLHTEAGFDIVSRVEGLEEIAEILRHHHERWDGDGYPRGLKGEQIPFASRVVAVADTFDAIVTDRPYRAALTPLEAKVIICELSGSHFDPTVIKAFEEVFPQLEACFLDEAAQRD